MTVYYKYLYENDVSPIWVNLTSGLSDMLDETDWAIAFMNGINKELALFNGRHLPHSGVFEFETEQDKFAFLLKWS